jgi:hypothetical protein
VIGAGSLSQPNQSGRSSVGTFPRERRLWRRVRSGGGSVERVTLIELWVSSSRSAARRSPRYRRSVDPCGARGAAGDASPAASARSSLALGRDGPPDAAVIAAPYARFDSEILSK